MADWIFRGTLTKGFHIQRTKAFTYQDRRYWVKQFTQITSVPKFLDKALNVIFETGKAINLLNLIRNTVLLKYIVLRPINSDFRAGLIND